MLDSRVGLFTRLSASALAEIAGRFRLGTIHSAHGIAQGTINSNYRLVTDAGAVFARVNEGKGEPEVAYEAELVSHLAARGVATPTALPADDGRRYAVTSAGLVTLFAWVDGEHRSEATVSPDDCRATGEALAALHLAGTGFPHRSAGRYGFERIVERYEGLAADCCDAVLSSVLADLAEEIAWLEPQTRARQALPGGVIHGDLFPDNVLFDPAGRLAALLDFEQASDGTFAYDLAVCLCAWTWGGDFVPARVQALIEGYRGVRKITSEEGDQLPVEARAVALRFTVTRLTDVYLNPDAAPEVRREKDFRYFHARLRRLRSLGADGFAALLVA